MGLKISVIIPVYNDEKRLVKCLDALNNQTISNESFEVIVVDNGSRNDIRHIEQKYHNVRVLIEEKPGSYAARNKGVKNALGEIIAFTDSDCIPNKDWLEYGVECLNKEKNTGLIGGKVDLFFINEKKLSLAEIYEKALAFPQEINILKNNYSVTANMITFKNIFLAVGEFDEELKSNGDSNWGNRVYNKGFKLSYCEKAIVNHPARSNLAELTSKAKRIIGGKRDSQKNRSAVRTILEILKILSPPFRLYRRILTEKRVNGIANTLKVLFVVHLIRFVQFLELIRLQLGSNSKR